MKIEINNCVDIESLYNSKTWIHGNSGENIKITIFIITICGDQLKYCLNAINNLDTNIPVLVNVIMNISPTSKAYNTMVERCTTEYFIQLDEDMELFPNAITIITKDLKNIKKNSYLHYYYLIDDYLGINNPPVIIGIKIYNNKIMKNYHIPNFNTNIVSSVDQIWHEKIVKDGYKSTQFYIPIGYHAKKRSCFDIMLRYCKMVKSILDPRIQSHRSDKLKIIKPMNKIDNFNKVYMSIVSHFIKLNYPLELFIKNNDVLIEYLSTYTPPQNLVMYEIPNNFIIVDRSNTYSLDMLPYLQKIPLGENMVNVKHIYAIIGIVNTLFENYQYSYTHYPYDIDKYFKKILQFSILFIINNDDDKNRIVQMFTEIDSIDNNFLVFDFTNCLSNQDIEKYDLIVDTNNQVNIDEILYHVYHDERKIK